MADMISSRGMAAEVKEKLLSNAFSAIVVFDNVYLEKLCTTLL